MRDIKFRGKRVDNGEWAYGYLVQNNGWCVIVKEFEPYGCEYGWGMEGHEVIPETVGEFTGRTAQCKDEIFEGDRCIVTTFDHNGADYQHECVVIWNNGCLAFSNEEQEFWMPVAYIEDTDSNVEVIGNIYDKEANNG